MKAHPYDVFISHAVEDKSEVADELYTRLLEAGINVWYSGAELQVGGDLYQMIKDGLNKSRHGILILSPHFFDGGWPVREFHVLWAKRNARILPVWHNITKEEIEKHDKTLAECWAVNTKIGLDKVTATLVTTLNQSKKRQKWTNVLGILFISIFVASGIWFFLFNDAPPDDLIQATVEKRISTFQEEVLIHQRETIRKEAGAVATLYEVQSFHDRYDAIESYYRNSYRLTNGYIEIDAKKNVEPALKLDLDALSPYIGYGFHLPNIFKIVHSLENELDIKYVFLSTQPVIYEPGEPVEQEEGVYRVPIVYENNIRYLMVSLQHTTKTDWMKRRSIEFMALLPIENYHFKKEGDDWVFIGLE